MRRLCAADTGSGFLALVGSCLASPQCGGAHPTASDDTIRARRRGHACAEEQLGVLAARLCKLDFVSQPGHPVCSKRVELVLQRLAVLLQRHVVLFDMRVGVAPVRLLS